MAHAVVRTDNLAGTDVRSLLVSVKYMGSGGETETDIDNGNVVKIDALVEGEREIFVGKDVAASDSIKDVVLIATPEIFYDERLRNPDEFYNAAGTICRGYHFHAGGIFSVTEDALDGTKEVGNVVELAAGTKLNTAASATSGSTVVGRIIEKAQAGRYVYYAIKVADAAAEGGD